MQKQFLGNPSKHSAPASKSLLRDVNFTIINTFNRIEKDEINERSIDKELNWLAMELKKNWEILNPVHTTTLLNKLANLELDNQQHAIVIIELTLKKCNELLTSNQMKSHFTKRELAQIFNALPKLPIAWSKNHIILTLFIERANTLLSRDHFDLRDSANILDGLAKLGIDLYTHRVFIKNLLQPFDTPSETFAELELITLSELWQFCLFARTKMKSATIDKLFLLVDKELKGRKREVIPPSLFQQNVYQLLLGLLKDNFKEKLAVEHPVGAYSLDLAFPEQKLNIEIDGPFHYREGKLKRIHQFRDFILQTYDNWKVVRFPHFEWEQLENNNQAKMDYLLNKLNNYDFLFNQQSLERLKMLPRNLNKENKSNNLNASQLNFHNNSIAEIAKTHSILNQASSTDTALQPNANKLSTDTLERDLQLQK